MFKERHFFAGNNTSSGFYSYFDNIINPEQAKKIYILKGGPGVGKSSLMKKFAKKMTSLGHSIEYIHCSSDENSLDGILFPKLKIAMVDGTAPHTIDPKIPGVTDEIVNLGYFINNNEIEKHKEQIIQINKKKSLLYKSAYRYLKSANIILEENNSIYDRFTDDEKFLLLCNNITNKLFDGYKRSKTLGNTRKLFAEAYTANGYIDYSNTLCDNLKIWAVIGENTNYTSKFLDTIVKEATRRGFYTECYYTAINPEKIKHVIIPDLNIMLMSAENHLNCNYEETIDLHETINLENLKSHISEIENNLHLFDSIMKYSFNKLSETKKYHELLEVFYVNSMNFEGVDEYYENILSDSLNF